MVEVVKSIIGPREDLYGVMQSDVVSMPPASLVERFGLKVPGVAATLRGEEGLLSRAECFFILHYNRFVTVLCALRGEAGAVFLEGLAFVEVAQAPPRMRRATTLWHLTALSEYDSAQPRRVDATSLETLEHDLRAVMLEINDRSDDPYVLGSDRDVFDEPSVTFAHDYDRRTFEELVRLSTIVFGEDPFRCMIVVSSAPLRMLEETWSASTARPWLSHHWGISKEGLAFVRALVRHCRPVGESLEYLDGDDRRRESYFERAVEMRVESGPVTALEAADAHFRLSRYLEERLVHENKPLARRLTRILSRDRKMP